MAEASNEEENYILHVVVVGFHHKKGCQVEYSYPPLIEGNTVESHEIPKEWKHLPSLALPDGAHNYVKDTVYFHLPGRKESRKTVYGVSCYRQMDAKDLKNRGADVTRSTVQKSVCVLSRLPLYGLIKAKLELITHAYFDECDFSKVELLEQTYNNMKTCISSSMVDGSSLFLGLSSRDVVLLFKHKIVLLFKLILLERRVLLYGLPVESLGGLLLSILSLYPGMLEHGLDEAVSKSSQKVSSSDVNITGSDMDSSDGYLEISYTNKGNDSLNSLNNAKDSKSNDEPKTTVDNSPIAGESSGSESLSSSRPNSPGPELKQDGYGFPLAIFTRGTVCHPYLSLQYHDILHDITIRGFLIGATNILFKQRRNLLDAIIEVNEGKIEIQDKELQKHLHLTTADLRFGEYIVKAVTEDSDKDNSFDNTEWEGGDEWIRGQFRLYILSMLATLLQDDNKLLEDFGTVFITAWKTTNNYRYWNSTQHPLLSDIPVGHPFQGHMNMNDIKVRLAHTMQSTDRGKKINAAVVQTGKYVVETGKAVGGALNNAKSAVSSWFSSWRTTSNDKTPSNSTDNLQSLASDNTVNEVNTNT
ncbi:hypothetical protein LOTGIDRAFT_206952 [Lottia gigantea]|uniref:UDENN domain-containing protein n=1 Tax=Lottia gigantea TaxID=225164 RepID=V3ZUH7_LOTGI|nr:hypothetical protein LOTGIDRAFT_206952 [Lottia gigantea]ESO88012.1 hypothetical protein LOTGIDRAFT_206952 [Lottia gigantea]